MTRVNHGHGFAGVSEKEYSVHAVALRLPVKQVIFQMFEMALPLHIIVTRDSADHHA